MHRLALLVVAAASVALVGTPALAHFDAAARYTHKACPASAGNRIDPINVVFTTWGTWRRAESQVEAHVGWTAVSGSAQHFVDHGGCAQTHTQRASGQGSRFHARLRGQHADPTLGWTATAAAHHEDLVLFPVPCGHAVDANGPSGSGFDQARDELERRFTSAGHVSSRVWWGNTQSFKQCDGDYAASDGWTVFIQLHQAGDS
ncbi:MAG: hypothetical protein M3546_14435 [Actinomycetota bacterium]|nr:hypothetical protein [Actinomycetota bacterium]